MLARVGSFACLVVISSASREQDFSFRSDVAIHSQRGQANVACADTVDMILKSTSRNTDYNNLKKEITDCGRSIKHLKVDYSTHTSPTKYLKAVWEGLLEVHETMFESLDLSRKDPTGKGYQRGVAMEGFQYLKQIIQKSPKLKVFKLDNNCIGTEDKTSTDMLTEALRSVSLTTLSLRNNRFDDQQLQDLGFWHWSLQELYLDGNRLTFEGWIHLKSFNNVKVFHASSNKISDFGAQWLCGGLKVVSVLRLANNGFTREGVEYLLDCSPALSELDISHSDCSGLKWDAWDLVAPTVKKLKVENAKLGTTGIIKLYNALTSRDTTEDLPFVELDLRDNVGHCGATVSEGALSETLSTLFTRLLPNTDVKI